MLLVAPTRTLALHMQMTLNYIHLKVIAFQKS